MSEAEIKANLNAMACFLAEMIVKHADVVLAPDDMDTSCTEKNGENDDG